MLHESSSEGRITSPAWDADSRIAAGLLVGSRGSAPLLDAGLGDAQGSVTPQGLSLSAAEPRGAHDAYSIILRLPLRCARCRPAWTAMSRAGEGRWPGSPSRRRRAARTASSAGCGS